MFSFLGLSQSLPVTSYIKMIDIWMLFTMTIPFLEVVLHTTNEVFKRPRENRVGSDNQIDVVMVKPAKEQEEDVPKDRKRQSSNLVRLTGRYMLPASSLVFTFIFWVVGILASLSSDDAQDPNMTDCLTVTLH